MNFYEPYDKYVIRKPLFSYNILFNSDNITLGLDEIVTKMLDNKEFVTSIYWSSPDLYEMILCYKNKTLKTEKTTKLFSSLKKYAIRSSTRCTPYGTFAGSAVRSINTSQNISTKLIRTVSVDMDFLNKLIIHIQNNQSLRTKLNYKVNNTLFSVAGQFRFYEPVEDGKHHLSSLQITEYLELLTNLNDYTSYSEIIQLFASDIKLNEISAFLDQLIDMNFLISEIQLKVTECNLQSIYLILSKLEIVETEQYLNILSKMQECIFILASTPINFLPKKEIDRIRNLAKELGINNTHFFNVDLTQSSDSDFVLSKTLVNNINTSINILNHLATENAAKNDLEIFKNIFTLRFDLQEVPLMQVLDPEYGIEYPASSQIGHLHTNELIAGINKEKNKDDIIKTSLATILLDLIENTKEKVIKLENNSFQNIPANKVLAPNFFIVGLSTQDSFFLQTVGTSSASSILGRFASGNPEIKILCEELRKDEQESNKDVIYAEILFIPEKRTANIAVRPSFSNYEIPIFTESHKKDLQQILLSDIMVCIRNDEIILRSKRLNKKIIPVLSNAHNFHNSDNSCYKFLASIQSQNEKNFNFSVNYAELKKRFIPRISYRNIILHRATWILHENDITKIIDSEDALLSLKNFILKWEIGNLVVLVQNDNELFLDISKEDYLLLLIEELKKSKLIQLSEWLLQDSSNLEYNQQIILPLKNTTDSQGTALSEKVISTSQRNFAPGSEWLYLKIYCNSKIADFLLINEIKPVIDNLLHDKLVKSVFFIRYTDPHYHLRIRFKLNSTKIYSVVLQTIYAALNPFFIKGIIWNINLDTYSRELERYHTDNINTTEKAFHYDTSLILKLLLFKELTKEDVRLFTAVKNVDYWLSLHDLSTSERLEYSKKLEAQLSSEFSPDFKSNINFKYRELKEDLYLFMKSKIYNKEFVVRHEKLKNLQLSRNNISSHIHMSLNRLFSSEQRALELMTYSFAVKYYGRILYQKS